MKAIEPSSSLVNRLADVIGGESAIGVDGVVVEGVVPLRKGHGTRVKPGVHDLWYAPHLTGTVFGGTV